MNDVLQVRGLASMTRTEAENAIRTRARTVYLGRGKALTHVLGSCKMFLSTDDLGFGSHVMLDGFWEIWLTIFFARYITPGMTVFDVGANFGYFTLLFGAAVGPSGRVIAIEPMPSTVALLNDTIELNGLARRARVIAGAAGAVPASHAHILSPPREPKNASVIDAPQEGSIAVASFTIDELVADYDRVHLVKIDVEGAEADVITGMHETISKHRSAILLKFNAARIPRPRVLLELLLSSYASLSQVGWDGNLEPVSPESVLSQHFGEDWLLFFESRAS
jgi:FkbM family methyltransferase